MFNCFKKKEKKINFPELKAGDWVYFKEEYFWEEMDDYIGITRRCFGSCMVF